MEITLKDFVASNNGFKLSWPDFANGTAEMSLIFSEKLNQINTMTTFEFINISLIH